MKAIIIGASSGIGRELAKILAREGYKIGVVARRKELLVSLQNEIHSSIFIRQADISHPEEAMAHVDLMLRHACCIYFSLWFYFLCKPHCESTYRSSVFKHCLV